MSYFVGGAIIAGTVASAYSANKASKEQSKGVKKGLDQAAALANQARQDVMGLFDRSLRVSNLSMDQMLNYYKTAAPKRISPYLQGNKQAQQVIGQGAQQANNAILGLPVDMSFTNQPQIVPGTDHLNAQLPDYAALDQKIAEENAAKQAALLGQATPQSATGKQSGISALLSGGGLLADPTSKDFYNPVNHLTNPLGLGSKIDDKINPVKSVKKAFKKLF